MLNLSAKFVGYFQLCISSFVPHDILPGRTPRHDLLREDVQLRPRGLVRVRHRGFVPRRRERDRRNPEHLPIAVRSRGREISFAGALAAVRLKIRGCIERSFV